MDPFFQVKGAYHAYGGTRSRNCDVKINVVSQTIVNYPFKYFSGIVMKGGFSLVSYKHIISISFSEKYEVKIERSFNSYHKNFKMLEIH